MKQLSTKARKTLLTVVMTGAFGIVASSTVYAVSILPVDTLLQQAYTKIQWNNFSTLTKSLAKGGNIYDSAYKLAEKTALGDAIGAFDSVSDNLNHQYGCSLTSRDISTITVTNPSLNASFAWLAGKTAFTVSSDDIVKSCVRIAQCVHKTAGVRSLTDSYTQDTYPLCTKTVQEAFTNTISLVAKQNSLDSANHGDDIFYNGSLDDSPYDLLLDMQLIGDVLFKSNVQAPQIIFYDFPKGKNSSANPVFFNANGDGSLNIPLTTNNNTTPNSTSTTNVSTSVAPITNSNQWAKTQSSSPDLQKLALYNQSLTQVPLGSINAWVLCITGTTIETPTDPTTIRINDITQGTNLGNAISTYNTAIDTPNALHDGMSSTDMQTNDAAIDQLSNISDPDKNTIPGVEDKINSCISKCDSQAPADKLLCQAKCLCGTKYSNDGIFGISVCTVPVAQPSVIAGKTVKSIEEIVDEINSVLTALRNSWQLMKHTKPTEFLDTSLSKIKLNQILSIDMNVAFKPIFDSRYQKEKTEKKKSENNAEINRARQWSYQGVGQEKNKYIILKNPIQEQTASTHLGNENTTTPTPTPDPMLPYTIAKTLNNTMINTISDFMQQNVTLRQQVSETMDAINITAGGLEKKIENGK